MTRILLHVFACHSDVVMPTVVMLIADILAVVALAVAMPTMLFFVMLGDVMMISTGILLVC